MSELPPDIQAADAQAAGLRAGLRATLVTTRERLAPAALKQEATDAAMDVALRGIHDAKAIARENPAKLLVFIAAVGAIAARRPLGSFLRRSFVKGRNYVQTKRAQARLNEEHHGSQQE